MPGRALVPAPKLAELTPEELEDLELDDKRAEAWYLARTAHSQVEIAKRFGVSRRAVQKWLAHEAAERLSRRDLVDDELERIVGVMEAVVEEAWKAHRTAFATSPGGLAASNYLRLVLDAARELAAIRGLTGGAEKPAASAGRARVVVRIGGSGAESTVEIGAEAS